ncbi:hypothetical protein FQR65_LT13325 [Abscondita terminalis]|nr:hypothetical protein FQR65_LT13325 [Abscondita terminalis]
MTISVQKNFVTNVKSKPPLVVFTVCLLGIIITTVCLTYYIQYQDEIPDDDAISDWISMLKHVNKLDLCSETSKPISAQDTLPRDGTTATISTPAKLIGLGSNTKMNLQGLIHLSGWASKCPSKAYIPTYIELDFDVVKRNETSDEDVCVTITGPTHLMPVLKPNQFCKTSKALKKTKWAMVSTKDGGYCKKGPSFQLKFDLDYNQNLKYDSYLSKEDRMIISSHLIVTSCFLMFVVILITCYALVRKTTGAVTENKQHLITKGIYL